MKKKTNFFYPQINNPKSYLLSAVYCLKFLGYLSHSLGVKCKTYLLKQLPSQAFVPSFKGHVLPGEISQTLLLALSIFLLLKTPPKKVIQMCVNLHKSGNTTTNTRNKKKHLYTASWHQNMSPKKCYRYHVEKTATGGKKMAGHLQHKMCSYLLLFHLSVLFFFPLSVKKIKLFLLIIISSQLTCYSPTLET